MWDLWERQNRARLCNGSVGSAGLVLPGNNSTYPCHWSTLYTTFLALFHDSMHFIKKLFIWQNSKTDQEIQKGSKIKKLQWILSYFWCTINFWINKTKADVLVFKYVQAFFKLRWQTKIDNDVIEVGYWQYNVGKMSYQLYLKLWYCPVRKMGFIQYCNLQVSVKLRLRIIRPVVVTFLLQDNK